jgi:hypothetical protein
LQILNEAAGVDLAEGLFMREVSSMIDVIFQVAVLHHGDEKVHRIFSLHAQVPALPPSLADTQFKLVPGVATILRDPLLTWNQVLGRYVISGFIKPTTLVGSELLVDGLLKQGWHEEESHRKDELV